MNLQPRRRETRAAAKKGKMHVQGALTIRIDTPPEVTRLFAELRDARDAQTTANTLPSVHVKLTCVRAEGLRSADCCGYGASDPFCVVFRDGRKVGKTRAISNNNNPEWKRKHKNVFALDDVPTRLVPKDPPDPADKKTAGGGDDDDADDGGADASAAAAPRGSRFSSFGGGGGAKGGAKKKRGSNDDDDDDDHDDDDSDPEYSDDDGGGGDDDDDDDTATKGSAGSKKGAKKGADAKGGGDDDDAKDGGGDAKGGDDDADGDAKADGDEGDDAKAADAKSKSKKKKPGDDNDDAIEEDEGQDKEEEEEEDDVDDDEFGDDDDDDEEGEGSDDGEGGSDSDSDDDDEDAQDGEPDDDVAVMSEDELAKHAKRLKKRARSEPQCVVRVEVYDHDPIGHDFLGYVELDWRRLMVGGHVTLKLRDRELPPNAKVKPKPKRLEVKGNMTLHVEHIACVEMQLTSAWGLGNYDPSGKSDPYVVAHYPYGTKLGKSKVRDNTLDPHWFERWTMRAPLVAPPEGAEDVTLEVWEHDTFSRHDFMGRVIVKHADLIRPNLGAQWPLGVRPGAPEDTPPQGALLLETRASFIPKIKPKQNYQALEPIARTCPSEAERARARRAERGHLDTAIPEFDVELCILRAGDLAKMDRWSKSDPFCIVRVDGYKVGKTRVKSNTQEPVWKDESFWVKVPLMSDPTAKGALKEVRIEVWDDDLFSKSFMGCVKLDAQELLEPEKVSRTPVRRYELQGMEGLLADEDAQGWLEIRTHVLAKLEVNVKSAKGLRAVDLLGGKSDPYCVMRWEGWNARKAGKTNVIDNCLEPKWDHELPVGVPVGSHDGAAALVIEVWDYDLIGSDDFLGLVVLEPALLLEPGGRSREHTLPLRDRKLKEYNKGWAQGELTIVVDCPAVVARQAEAINKARFASNTRNELPDVNVRLDVLRGDNLKRMESGGADPYAVVLVDGRRIGRTRTCNNTLKPRWGKKPKKGATGAAARADPGEVFMIDDVPSKPETAMFEGEQFRYAPCEMEVNVRLFDDDPISDDCMGEAVIDWDLIMLPGEHTLELYDPLKAPPNCCRFFRCHSCACCCCKLKKPRKLPLAQRSQKHCKGTLTVRVRHVAKVQLHILEAYGVRKADWMGGSDPYCVVKYLDKRVAKTKVRANTQDPRWYHMVELEIPVAPDGDEEALAPGDSADVLVEVWEHDTVGADDFLGRVVLTRDMLLRPHSADVFKLQPRPGKPKEPIPSGYLDLHITCSFLPGKRVPLPDGSEWRYEGLEPDNYPRWPIPLDPNAASMAKALATRRELKVAHDEAHDRSYYFDPATRESFWVDPRPKPPPPATTEPVFVLPPPPPLRNPSVEKFDFAPTIAPPEVELEVVVLRCGDLKNVDTWGKSDPFVRLRVDGHGRETMKSPVRRVGANGKMLKKDVTPVKSNNLNPVWEDANAFRLPMPLNDNTAGVMLEVWDDDGLFFGSDSLGEVRLSATELLNSSGATIRRPLRPTPGGPTVTGWIEVRVQLLAKITLHVICARGLRKVDLLGKGDPYAVIRWEGWNARKLGKTKTKYNTDKPRWEHACELTVPLQRPGGRVVIEVFDYDAIGADDLLGRVVFETNALVGFGNIERWVPLRDRPPVRTLAVASKKQKAKQAKLAAAGGQVSTGELRVRVACAPELAALAAVAARAKTLQRTMNVLPALAGVEIDIIRCKGLRKADRSGDSDPFVVLYRLGEHKATKTRKQRESAARKAAKKRGSSGGGDVESANAEAAAAAADTAANGDANKETRLGRTKTKSNTLHPKWEPAETFRLDEVRTVTDQHGDPPNDGVLLEVWDDDLLPHKRDFLGQALVDWHKLMVPGVHELQLRDKTAEDIARRKLKAAGSIKRLCKFVCCLCVGLAKVCRLCGKCVCFCFCGPCKRKGMCGCCSNERPHMTGSITIRVRHIAKVELSVLEAFGLPKKDLFGGSDPYATVRYVDNKLLKTRVKDNSQDPKWYEHVSFEMVLPDPKEVPGWDAPERAFDVHPDDEAIVIDVWEHDTFSADDFMGRATLRRDALLRPHLGTDWPLERRPEKPLEVVSGYLDLRVAASFVPGYLEQLIRRPNGDLGAYAKHHDEATKRTFWADVETGERFWRAPTSVPAHLLRDQKVGDDAEPDFDDAVRERFARLGDKYGGKVDDEGGGDAFDGAASELPDEVPPAPGAALSADEKEPEVEITLLVLSAAGLKAGSSWDKSDPFALVKCNGRALGRTKVKNNEVNPVWLQQFTFVCPLGGAPLEIGIEIWDWDATGKNDFLGQLFLSKHELLHTPNVLTKQLQGIPGGCRVTGSLSVRSLVMGKACLHLLGGRHLKRVDLLGGGADPYARVKWEGHRPRRLAKSRTCYGTRAPAWDKTVPLAVPMRWPGNMAVIEVWDHDSIGADDFLGCLSLGAEQLFAHRVDAASETAGGGGGASPTRAASVGKGAGTKGGGSNALVVVAAASGGGGGGNGPVVGGSGEAPVLRYALQRKPKAGELVAPRGALNEEELLTADAHHLEKDGKLKAAADAREALAAAAADAEVSAAEAAQLAAKQEELLAAAKEEKKVKKLSRKERRALEEKKQLAEELAAQVAAEAAKADAEGKLGFAADAALKEKNANANGKPTTTALAKVCRWVNGISIDRSRIVVARRINNSIRRRSALSEHHLKT